MPRKPGARHSDWELDLRLKRVIAALWVEGYRGSAQLFPPMVGYVHKREARRFTVPPNSHPRSTVVSIYINSDDREGHAFDYYDEFYDQILAIIDEYGRESASHASWHSADTSIRYQADATTSSNTLIDIVFHSDSITLAETRSSFRDLGTLRSAALKEAWESISEQFLSDLIDSMRDRCQAVIDANGLHTKF
ncbi:MAG: hypothetical protein M1816_003476 [Peltula sp. TS41687]|nr:MAG: hypothetical protein M1816_003476 [Peltula sp. TS41687]